MASLSPWRRRTEPAISEVVALALDVMVVLPVEELAVVLSKKSIAPEPVDCSVPPVRDTAMVERVRLPEALWVTVPPAMMSESTFVPVLKPRASWAVVSKVPPVFTVTVPRRMPVPPPPLALS